jgi:4-hydroxy-tetrahydrodipicolinate synthase
VLFIETNPGPLKFAMGALGRCAPEIRLPLCEPSPANQAKIRSVLAQYGL